MGAREPQVSTSLKVLQVVSDTDRRGAQVFATDLHEALESLGHRVATVALRPGTRRRPLDVRTLGWSRWSPSMLRELRRRSVRADVVVAHGSSTLVACVIAMSGTRTPLVYRQISDPLFWASSAIRRARVSLYLRRVQKVVALSPDLAATVRRHYGLAADRVEVIPNAVPAGHFRRPSERERAEARDTYGIPEGVPVALFVGALAEEKGVQDAVLATAGVDGLHLLVIGDGPERASLEALGRRVAPGRVDFAGPTDDVRRAYWASDLLLFPSRAGDSMPAVLIEAGLCGLPVVATNVGAIGEVVLDDDTGLLIAPGRPRALSAAVRRVRDDGVFRHRAGEAAEARCGEHFTFSGVGPEWEYLLLRAAGVGRVRAQQW